MNSRFTGNCNAKISSQTSHPAASPPARQPFPDSIFPQGEPTPWEGRGPLDLFYDFYYCYFLSRPHFIQISRASPVLGFRGSNIYLPRDLRDLLQRSGPNLPTKRNFSFGNLVALWNLRVHTCTYAHGVQQRIRPVGTVVEVQRVHYWMNTKSLDIHIYMDALVPGAPIHQSSKRLYLSHKSSLLPTYSHI